MAPDYGVPTDIIDVLPLKEEGSVFTKIVQLPTLRTTIHFETPLPPCVNTKWMAVKRRKI